MGGWDGVGGDRVVLEETVYKGRGTGHKEKRASKSALLLPQLQVYVCAERWCVFPGVSMPSQKAPVRPAYLPCSKTQEGVYPAVKVERGCSGIRFRATLGSSVLCITMGRGTHSATLVPLFNLSYGVCAGSRG